MNLHNRMEDGEIEEEMVTPVGSSHDQAEMSDGEQSAPGEEEEDEDLYYIPERRPSLDLGPSPMDTSHWYYVDKALLPVQNYGSMTSEESLDRMDEDNKSSTRVHLARSGSYSSCYSVDSDNLETKIPKVKVKDETEPEVSLAPDLTKEPEKISHPSLTVPFTFMAISKILEKLSVRDLDTFEKLLWKRCPGSLIMPPKGQDLVGLVDWLLQCYGLEGSLTITKALLEDMKKKRLADYLQTLRVRNEVRHDLCETLRRIYCADVCVDSTKPDETKPFNDVFTNLYISSSCDNGPNTDHEVLTIPKLDSNQDREKLLSTGDIMSAERLEKSNFRLLLITGAAGSGKTMAIRKLILDWIEERAHKHIGFIFPLPFRELKRFEGVEMSLVGMINALYPETQRLTEEDYESKDCPMMFIFDGLDEYHEELDFRNTELHMGHTQPASLNVTVVNLLRGKMLYHGIFVFLARPQVRRVVPWDTAYNEIEMRGFRNPEKDEYFRRRFKDPEHAERVIAYVNSLKTLRVMCHLPLFCSLVADEYQQALREQGPGAELPRSITFMYTKLLLALIRQRREPRGPQRSPEDERAFLMKLGELAFQMLDSGEFKISKLQWKEGGVSDDEEAVVNSGLCLQYITKPFVLYQEKTISFLHPTMQEYLAALYVFLSFRNQEKNVYEQKPKGKVKEKLAGLFKTPKAAELYRSAVDRSLLCEDGKQDVFLRFLLGTALKPNLELLQPFLTSAAKWPAVIDDAAAHIRKRIQENQYPARNDNLRRCLEELGMPA